MPPGRERGGCRVVPAGAAKSNKFYEMRQKINWRHGVLLALMAVGLYLVGGDVESEAAFFAIKPLGLASLWAMYRLHERWWREGKIAKYRLR